MPNEVDEVNNTQIKVRVNFNMTELEYEFESVDDVLAMFESSVTQLAQIREYDRRLSSGEVGGQVGVTGDVQVGGAVTATEPAKRTRRTKAQIAADASAPPTIQAPPTVPTAPALAIPADGGIPAFLDRKAPAPVAVTAPAPLPVPGAANAAPPPPAAVSTPPAPPPPPSVPSFTPGVVGQKIVAAIKDKVATAQDGGAAWKDWIVGAMAGHVVPGASYDDVLACLPLTKDQDLGEIVTALGLQS